MPYKSRSGRRPDEAASKSSHSHIIQDEIVQAFLAGCAIPRKASEVDLKRHRVVTFEPVVPNPIKHVIAVDSGVSFVPVQKEFPSATLGYFQFGALAFSIDDLVRLGHVNFIDPDDMAKLKRIQRVELVLPIRNVVIKSEGTLEASVRRAVYEFFRQKVDDGELIETLKWLIFQEYDHGVKVWPLASCPDCHKRDIGLLRAEMSRDYTFRCDSCRGTIYLTDVFRLHEAVDNELGAAGVVGYVTTAFEQLILAHMIRMVLRVKPSLLGQILFIKDGPLAFFGQTANMHKPMRYLAAWLLEHEALYMAGLEKSGPFVESADELSPLLRSGSLLILDNEFIYEYVIPGRVDSARPYGSTTYYSNKVFFKTPDDHMHVVSIPTTTILDRPTEDDLSNLAVILTNIDLLRCDMYDNALIPVALANKLVSLSSHPSSKILETFSREQMAK